MTSPLLTAQSFLPIATNTTLPNQIREMLPVALLITAELTGLMKKTVAFIMIDHDHSGLCCERFHNTGFRAPSHHTPAVTNVAKLAKSNVRLVPVDSHSHGADVAALVTFLAACLIFYVFLR